MRGYLGILIAAAIFTIYEGPAAPDPRIEATTDRGPIVEMIVRCKPGTAIISYSKMERLYCDPKLVCSPDKNVVIQRACG